jgi:hypothetical protein
MFPQKILTFHSWEIFTENSAVPLRFGLHDPKRNQPNFRKGKKNAMGHLCRSKLEI